jgi:hypothetical protein
MVFGADMMASDKRRDTQAYWEARLKRMGLDAERGRPSWLSYGHDVTFLDTDGRKTYHLAGETQRENEWPISL